MNVAKSVWRGRNRKTTWWWNEEVTGSTKKKAFVLRMAEEKLPKIKRTILGYEKESWKSGGWGKERHAKSRSSWKEKFRSTAVGYVFQLRKQSKMFKKEIMRMPCIPGKDGKLKGHDRRKLKFGRNTNKSCRMKKMIGAKSLEITKVEGPYEQVSAEDMVEAFAVIKAAWPSGVSVELLNICKKRLWKDLPKLQPRWWMEIKCRCWRKSGLIPIVKRRCEICRSYLNL